MTPPTVLIVPGLRDAIDAHWQTLLAAELPQVRAVPAMGRATVDCTSRVQAIEDAAQAIDGPIVIVAHSAGCVMVMHWAAQTQRPVLGALLATPPDLTRALPPGYPPVDALQAGGWPWVEVVHLLLASQDNLQRLVAEKTRRLTSAP